MGTFNGIRRYTLFIYIKTMKMFISYLIYIHVCFIQGGAISILSVRQRPDLYKAVVLSSPLVKLADEKLNLVNIYLAPILGSIFPKVSKEKKRNEKTFFLFFLSLLQLYFPEGLDPIVISRNKEAVEDYKKDPLVANSWIRLRVGAEFMFTTNFIQDHLYQVTTPLHIIHGDADAIVDIKGSYMIMERAGSKDKSITVCKGMYHEIYEDEERDLYVPKVIDWIKNKNKK